MKEYQFRLPVVAFIDINANNDEEALEIFNKSKHMLEESTVYSLPGPFKRLCLEFEREPINYKHMVDVLDIEYET